MKAVAALSALLASAASPVLGAQIDARNEVIHLVGQINSNDFEVFKVKAGQMGKGAVILDSPGGSLLAALQIGEMIRLRGWSTYVVGECSSACAMIWLGGVQRYMTPTAKIGFHAASVNGQEKGMGNALVGAYLNRIGLGYEAVIFATTASPDDITYLTPDDAKRVGIEVSVVSSIGVPQASPSGGGGGAPPCMAEFARLREDVQKLGLAAKTAGQRKVSREEMCKHITAYSAAELKWVKYTDANVKTCGIPAEVAQQLKQVHSNTEQTKEKICAAGRGGDL
jgi:ATP-dependent protease ClpP protease subunit